MKSLQTRATGASCKECRRLKIKCDKQVPCGTCTKRGLQSLCPDGQLSGTKGSRYVLASAEESWHRIQALCVRVQDLEFALDRAHSLVATDKHPLLTTELLKIGQDPRAVKPESSTSTPKAAEDVPISNFGTMKISKSGAYRWLGTTALPVLMLDDFDQEHKDSRTPLLQTAFKQEGATAARDGEPLSELKSAAIRLLPPRLEALKLIDIYFDFCWRWPLIVCRSTVMDSLFSPAYDGDATTLSSFNLSALYSILTLGTLFDMSQDPDCQEFKTRRHWAHKLFFLEWPRSPSTVDDLEALVLLFRISWPFLDRSYSDNYQLISWAIKLSEKSGLHRDPADLNLSTEECLRRRRVFWAIWYHDSVSSMILGLPPTLPKGFVDCRPPQETTEIGEDIHVQITLLVQDILSHFLEPGQTATYSTILRIDQEIRQIDVDADATYLRSIVASSGRPVSPEMESLTKGYVKGLCNVTMMCLHKAYFSYALKRSPDDPMAGKWNLSVQAMFESSTSLLKAAHNITKTMPGLHARLSPNWVHYHAAVLVLYGFPIYAPYLPQAADAIKAADAAISDVFQVHMRDSPPAATSLPSLLQCQSKAHASMAAYKAGTWVHPSQNPVTPTAAGEGEIDYDVFYNEKLVIAGGFPRRESPDHTISHSHRSSLSGYYDESTEIVPSSGSRKSSPGEALYPSASMYDHAREEPSSHYPHGNADTRSLYGTGSSSSSSSVVPPGTSGPYWNHIQSPVQQHMSHDPYQQPSNTSMEWSTSPVPAHLKVESPPTATLVWPGQHYAQTAGISALTIPHTPHLQQHHYSPEEYRSPQSAVLAPPRRPRGLSRARSFPSDHHYPNAIFTSMAPPPPVPSLPPQHSHTIEYPTMTPLSHYLTPATPVSAHPQPPSSQAPGQHMDHVQSPILAHPHVHPPQMYPQDSHPSYPQQPGQWTQSTYRPGPTDY